MATDIPELPRNLVTGLIELVQAMDQRGVQYALIGGLATGFRSRPRFTQDIDFMLQVPQVVLPGLLDDLHARGFGFDTAETIRRWVQEHMAVLAFRDVRVDWLKPVVPCYQRLLDGASVEDWLGTRVRVASPEGLIVTKLIAFRGQDQLDIENILAANRGQLDLDLIRREWQTVGEPDAPTMQRFDEMVRQFYSSPRGS